MEGRYTRVLQAAGMILVVYILADGALAEGLFLLIGLLGIAGVLVGIRLHGPPDPRPWIAVGLGLAAFVAGDLVWTWLDHAHPGGTPFPSIADALYLAAYPLLGYGLYRMSAQADRDARRAGLVDALLVGTAAGLYAWVAIIGPVVRGHDAGTLALLIALAYPVGSVVFITFVAMLGFRRTIRRPAVMLLLVGSTSFFLADVVYMERALSDSYVSGTLIDLAWLVAYLAMGLAALHPSMGVITRPGTSDHALSSERVLILGVAALAGPVALTVSTIGGTWSAADTGAVAVGAAALTGLIVLRLAGLAGDLVTSNAQRQEALNRSAVLAGVGSRLAAAADVREIDAIVEVAISELAAPDGRGEAELYLVPDLAPDHPDLRSLPDEIRIQFRGRGPVNLHAGDLDPGRRGRVVLAPLVVDDGIAGAIAVWSPGKLSADTRSAIGSLAATVSLTLDRFRLSAALREREERFRSLVQNAPDCITIFALDGTITYASPSVSRFGATPDELVGSFAYDLCHPDDVPAVRETMIDLLSQPQGSVRTIEYRWVRPDGSHRWAEATCTNRLLDPSIEGIVANHRDVTDRKALEAQLTFQALHDVLTGLANRATFEQVLADEIERSRREDGSIAVLYLDLDRFKSINDTFGHATGDELLAAVAERIKRSIRPDDTAARMGGDEFAVLLSNVDAPGAAVAVARRIHASLEEPFSVGGTTLLGRASIGVASLTPDVDAATLIRNADAAMYSAKGAGRGRIEVFEAGRHRVVLERLELEAELRSSLQRDDRLDISYQPIVDLRSSAVTGAEALIRWRHPHRGLLGPDEFLPAAEQTGLIVDLGRYVMMRVCAEAARWNAVSRRSLSVHVNVSPREFRDDAFVDHVRGALEEGGLAPTALVLELTEGSVVEDAEVASQTLHALRKLGVRVAIDDFGTGYSSLSYLKRLPVDILKIDRSFVAGLTEEPEDAAVAQAVAHLARTFDLELIAEGIEDQGQLEAVRELGCRLGQGYLFAPGVPAATFAALAGVQAPEVGASEVGELEMSTGDSVDGRVTIAPV